MKTLYIATAQKENADIYDLKITFDLAEARDAIVNERAHLTASELARTTLAISGYAVDDRFATAEEAHDSFDELVCLPDPVTYEEA